MRPAESMGRAALGALLIIGLLLPVAGHAGEFGWAGIGVRIGLGERFERDFSQYQVLAMYRLPWEWGSTSGPRLGFRMDLTAGILESEGDSGFITSLGPVLTVSGPKERIVLDCGISPTLIGRYEYGDVNLGGTVQFTSHAALMVRVWESVYAGYRIQHMSNSGLYDKNPGLNLHMLEVTHRF
jgi:lipid A 3-O-deacylase